MTIERGRLREIGKGLPEAARSLDRAIGNIVGLTVAESAFTSFTFSLAVAYGEIEAFTLRELGHRAEDIAVMGEMAGVSAATWADAEHAGALRAV
ncbi:hypothetical protein FHR32_003155 [Streptosporangium album]|uniref:Uncharacterized protein n=1 Tax=Streptosporangium album TaxID=47479 RepID=A0A7W7WA73_9ACTN|nr:hypothetical protein [Streptosporangium album]MBB4938850.1 hypothetical protein [Streptosporangium album]